MSALLALALAVALAAETPAPQGRGGMAEAERLAAEAVQLAPKDAVAALQKARRALAMTAEFVPTEFVTAGRKGEVVEDEFQAARDGYRRHRAGLYEAVGTASRGGETLSPRAATSGARSCSTRPRTAASPSRARSTISAGGARRSTPSSGRSPASPVSSRRRPR